MSVETTVAAAERPDAELPPAYLALLERLGSGTQVAPDRSTLVDDALSVWARPGFDHFMCLPRLRFEPFEHQLEAAGRVLRHMQGRAILADEVGLGKTIEACLVLSELRLRGLADRVLVVVPAGLVGQWCEELERKFALPWVVAGGGGWTAPRGEGPQPVVVTSLATARRQPLAALLGKSEWDVVVVDEAHRVKSARSASARLARSLQARYLLLLTATPVENGLGDLFALVSLVRPGALGSAAEFRSRHGGVGEGQLARNVGALRLAMRDVMVRHRRSELKVMLPRRLAETLLVTPRAAESDLYAAVSCRVRAQARGATASQLLALRSAQRMAGSSPAALAASLHRLGWDDLGDAADELGATAKTDALWPILDRHRQRGEKVIVFTAFRRTLELLEALAAEQGCESVSYHGGLSRTEKDRSIASFADHAPILLSTEAAGEGRNLQFCHVMVNFDLPWNPMQIEQRLGRIHRIGQRHDVVLTNLAARGTIEERILDVLQAKINLFELVVGELDMILGRVEEEIDLETAVFERYVASADDDEFTVRLDELGEQLADARRSYLQTRDDVDELVDHGEAA